MGGLGCWGNFPVWTAVCYGFDWLIHLFIFYFIFFIFHAFWVLVFRRSGILAFHVLVQAILIQVASLSIIFYFIQLLVVCLIFEVLLTRFLIFSTAELIVWAAYIVSSHIVKRSVVVVWTRIWLMIYHVKTSLNFIYLSLFCPGILPL